MFRSGLDSSTGTVTLSVARRHDFQEPTVISRQVCTPVFTTAYLSLPQARVRATKKGARMAYPL